MEGIIPDQQTNAFSSLLSNVNETNDLNISKTTHNRMDIWRGIHASCIAVIFLCSLVANTMVFVVFYRKPSLLTISNRFVLNLSVCNLLLSLFVMPFVFISSLMRDWILGHIWCQITGMFTTLLFAACILTLLVISIDRHYAITKPLHYTMVMTTRRVSMFISLVWIVAAILAIPPTVGWNHIQYQPSKKLCTVHWGSSSPFNRVYSFTIALTCFVIPFLAMLSVYICIYKAAQKTSAKARRNSIQPDQLESNAQLQNNRRRSSAASLLHHVGRRRSSLGSRGLLSFHRDDWKAAKTGLIVVSTFTLCWLPFFVLVTVEAILGDDIVPELVQSCAILIALSGCALDPIVYVFRSRAVKHEIRLFVCREHDPKQTDLEGDSGSLGSRKSSKILKLNGESTACIPVNKDQEPCDKKKIKSQNSQEEQVSCLPRSPSTVTFSGIQIHC